MNAKIFAFTLVIAFVLSAGIASALSNSGGGEWKYNKVIAIKENSGKTLTDYQVLIELKGSDFPEEAKSDGCDIRFSDLGGNELSYWIEEFDPSTRTCEIWVKVPEIPASGTVTVLMYYGNPSAGVVSDGDATFVFFDDFEGSELDTNKWSETYNYPVWTVSNSILTLRTSASTPQWNEAGIKAPENFSHEFRAIAKVKGNYDKADLRFYCVLGEPRYLLGLKIAYWGTVVYAYTTNSEDVSLFNYPSDSPWVRCMITKVGSRSQFYWDDFETPVYQEEDGWSDSYSLTRIGTTWRQQNVYCDYVFITKYADPEPIATIGTETNVNPVSDCVVIKSPGYYELAEDIINCTTKHCITITASDVVLDGAGHTIDGGDANASIERFGIYVKNSSTALSNVTVKNLNVTGWNTGIYFYKVKNSSIENNQVYNNKNGIYLDCSNHISLTNNTVYNNSDGIYYWYASRTKITNNTVYNNSVDGINLVVSHDNTITNNIINNNSGAGIRFVDSNNNALICNSAYNNGVGLHTITSSNTAIINNNLYKNTCGGISLYYSDNNTLIDNSVYNNMRDGILLSSENSTLKNNKVYNNMGGGIVLYHPSDNNTLNNNRVWNNKRNGLSITLSNGTIMNNNVYNNTQTGIELRDSNNIRLTNNSVSSNWQGIGLSDSNNNSLTHNSIYSNSWNGLRFDKSNGNTLTHNTVYDNGDNGISLYNSNNVIYNNIFNNVNNVYISASYTIWNTTKTPGTNIGGGGFLGGNAWLKPDGTGHSQTCNDSDYDGVCDKEYNLNLINIDYLPLKVVNVSTCMNITSTGYYKLINDIYSSAPCCINITASGVIFDGNGHKIENSGIGYSGHGICVYNTSTTLSNIIIKNVNVRRWESGILLERVEKSVIENNTAYDNWYLIKLLKSSNNSITKNSISRSSIYLVDSTNNCITNNNASQSGIYIERSNHNTITNNNVTEYSSRGIAIDFSNHNMVTHNYLLGNGEGITLSYSDNNIIASNNATKNGIGIYLIEYSHNNTIMNNTIYNNFGEGLRISYYSNNNSAINNTVNTNRNGIFLENARNNTVASNSLLHNNNDGMWILDSNNNTITKNIVCNNGNYGISLYSSNINLIYLNNFIGNSYSIGSSYSSNTFNSRNQIPYNYHIIEITGYMGNYWSDYNDIDTNGDGIWDNPYIISLDNDNYPLVEPFELYFAD